MKNLNLTFIVLLISLLFSCNTSSIEIDDTEQIIDDSKVYNVVYEVSPEDEILDKWGKSILRLSMKLPNGEVPVGDISKVLTRGAVTYKNTYWTASSWHSSEMGSSGNIAKVTAISNGYCQIETAHSRRTRVKATTNYKILKDGTYTIKLSADNTNTVEEKAILDYLIGKELTYRFSTEKTNPNCTLNGLSVRDMTSHFYMVTTNNSIIYLVPLVIRDGNTMFLVKSVRHSSEAPLGIVYMQIN